MNMLLLAKMLAHVGKDCVKTKFKQKHLVFVYKTVKTNDGHSDIIHNWNRAIGIDSIHQLYLMPRQVHFMWNILQCYFD